jgi:hypothetical protein
MKPFPIGDGLFTISVLAFLLCFLAEVNLVSSAELVPFPSRDRTTQFEQSTPRYRQTQPNPRMEQFRRDIGLFECPELQALYDRIRDQYNAATTAADRDYYNNILGEMYRELSTRCNR